MKVYTIVGARPQFMKAAVVTRAIVRGGIEHVLVHTGQHYDRNMSDVFFDELEIPAPDQHLGIGSAPHGAQTGRMLEALERSMVETKPDWVLIYGDTNSTLAGALAAAKLHIPVAHVEAGLRSFNRRMPEEINRVVADHTSDVLFAPTETAVENLRNEGVDDAKIDLVGDVMYDAALHYGEKAERTSRILEGQHGDYILATIHRAENTDDLPRLRAIFEGLVDVARELPVILPLHPRTRGVLEREGMLEAAGESIRLLDPVGYLDMVMLEKHARLIATDSGGVQKEAFFHGVPCVTLRDETEWVELVTLGWNRVAPPASAANVASAIRASLAAPRGRDAKPYGNGDASERIVARLRA